MSKCEYVADLGEFGEHSLTVEYKYTPGHPEYISGPPEDCYPAEGAELEVRSVSFKKEKLSGAIETLFISRLQESDSFFDHVSELEGEKA